MCDVYDEKGKDEEADMDENRYMKKPADRPLLRSSKYVG